VIRTLTRFFLLCAAPVALGAPQLLCHYTYGGVTNTLRSSPQSNPYTTVPVEIGSYFLFRPQLETAPNGLSAVKLYTYVNKTSGPAIIHQASYPYPAATRSQGKYGFTGLQTVYEPVRDSELSFWCEMTESR